MLINNDTSIKGKNVILVPYREHHVSKYHKWMQSKDLQHLTASQPLTLKEEYKMQKSWLADENKCTFIVLHREKYDSNQDEIESMIGDTNLFFSTEDRQCAEAEIMIAEKWARGKRCGLEAMLLMFLYAINFLKTKEFIVKISFDNEVSLKMFENIGFKEVSRSDVFKEITFCKVVDESWKIWLEKTVGPLEITKH